VPHEQGAAELQHALLDLVRGFGLHRPDRTPCDQLVAISEAHALMELDTHEALTQSDLARRLRLRKSTVSRLVGQMEIKGWLEREPDERDRRFRLLRLSAAGETVSRTIGAARDAKFQRLLDAIPEDQRDAVIESVRVLARASREEVDA
jgi:DNA-binding MarR family transcriptional regulator